MKKGQKNPACGATQNGKTSQHHYDTINDTICQGIRNADLIDYLMVKYQDMAYMATEQLHHLSVSPESETIIRATLIEQIRMANKFKRDLKNLREIFILMDSIKET